MRSRSARPTLPLIVLIAMVALAVARTIEAGPYLWRSIEHSPASSQKECAGQVTKVLRDLQREKRLTVAKDNDNLATTTDSTVHVDCIFVGPNEQRRPQWIFYIAIASTDRDEPQRLLKLLRERFNKIVRLD